jgi:hypothetical protein
MLEFRLSRAIINRCRTFRHRPLAERRASTGRVNAGAVPRTVRPSAPMGTGFRADFRAEGSCASSPDLFFSRNREAARGAVGALPTVLGAFHSFPLLRPLYPRSAL